MAPSDTTRENDPIFNSLLDSSSHSIRLQTIRHLSLLKPQPQQSIPILIRLLSNDPHPDIKAAAAIALGEYGIAEVAVLRGLNHALLDPSPIVREFAAGALHHLSEGSSLALINLVACLKDDFPFVRINAIKALSNLHLPPSLVIEALCDRLNDEEPLVRWQAINAFNLLDIISIRIVLSLENCLTDSSVYVRNHARVTLQKFNQYKNRAASLA